MDIVAMIVVIASIAGLMSSIVDIYKFFEEWQQKIAEKKPCHE